MSDMFGIFDLTGQRALVTGASSGLGRHFALTLAKAGAEVAVVARRSEKLVETVAAITANGGHAYAAAMDVTDRSSVCKALDDITQAFGNIDIVVNNAGVTDTKRPLDYTDEDWQAIVGTNLTGAWIVAQETSRRMIEANVNGVGTGSIINITSILADRVAGGVSPYSASKAGLKHLTQAFALELARHNIRVNSIAPGYISTDFNRDFLASEAGEKLKARIPARRFGDLVNLDGALLLLASRAGAYMTGAEIVVDGGHLCSSL
jgi:NAD(P)-dependent dehydrogenase (short-subunit alcohol dehydrogenase family)